jgi:hypothetical protein
MNVAIIGAAASSHRTRIVTRLYERPSQAKGDLDLPIGKFLVCGTGVRAELRDPLSMLSGHVPWNKVAPKIAALWLMVEGVQRTGEESFCDKVLAMMTANQRDQFEERLDTDGWSRSTEVLIRKWAPSIAARCPSRSASHDLRYIKSWDARTLDGYAKRHFLS